MGNLENGKEYRFKLRAVNAGGASDPAPNADPWYVAVTPTDGLQVAEASAVPAAPAGFRLIAGDQAITLVWDAAPDDADVTGYEYQQRDVTAGQEWGAWTAVPDADAKINAFGAINLTNGNEYRFRLRAVNDLGAGASAPTGDPDYAWEIAGMAHAATFQDYDTDNDDLIEISTAAQLSAIRHDSDGNGSNNSTYQTAFPNAVSYTGTTAMGCVNTCDGYELNQHLDLSSYTNWSPIGDYATTLKGNGYVISNLTINSTITSTSAENVGLFGVLKGSAKISDFTLNDADIYVKTESGNNAGEPRAGGVAGELESSGEVSFVSVTGKVRSERGSSAANAFAYAGGLVGKNAGDIVGAFSSAYVEALMSSGTQTGAAAGGVAGQNTGSIIASYFAGHVKANPLDTAHAGGIAGEMSGGSIKASYSVGKAEAVVSSSGSIRYSGGIVGNLSGGTVEAAYAAGEVAGSGGSGGGTRQLGGVAGNSSGGTLTNAYYDSTVMGTISTGRGTAKTTSELQSPTGYTGDYSAWNLNLDGVSGGDDPWAFGTSSQYPVIDYKSMSTALQRGVVTLTASPTTIYESAVPTASPARVNESTITATLNAARPSTTTVTLPADAAAYTTTPTNRQIVIPHGSLSATLTLTAVNNTTDAADNAVDLSLGATVDLPSGTTGTRDDPSMTVSSALTTLTIKDDDELAQVTGVNVYPRNASAYVTWQEVDGATGYVVQWKSSGQNYLNTGTTRRNVVSDAKRVTVATSLTNSTDYTFRVYATKTGADDGEVSAEVTGTPSTSIDYDLDGDDLIDVLTLAQLNAMRWDLDGNGEVTGSNQTSFRAAFSNASSWTGTTALGCAATCDGYELLTDLDFDTDGDGYADSGDTYWNSGRGWTPIGDSSTNGAYTGDFDGNNDSDTGDGGPWGIYNLFVDMEETSSLHANAGLFGVTRDATIYNVSLYNVSVHARTTSTNNTETAAAGALIGLQEGGVTSSSYAQGHVGAQRTGGSAQKYAMAGGLVGDLADSSSDGTIRLSAADVDATALSSVQDSHTAAGGLVGRSDGNIEGSYATGDVVSETTATHTEANGGGLVGRVTGGVIKSTYATGDVHVEFVSSNATSSGLVGYISGGSVYRSYATGAPTGNISGVGKCGAVDALVGVTVSEVYWDTTTSGISTACDGTGYATSALQSPRSKSGIYTNWDDNVDGVANDDNPWDFGRSSEYPRLHIGILDKEKQRATRLQQVTGLTVNTGAANTLNISWTAATAPAPDGYILQWKTSTDPFFNATRQRTLTKASFMHSVTGAHTYRVFAIKRGVAHGPVSAEASGTPASTIDYDSDDDGLIEITKIEQLRYIHYDLNGDGLGDTYDSNGDGDYDDAGEYDYRTTYQTEFPNAIRYTGATTLGCPSTGCKGYELRANLDFNQDGSYRVPGGSTKYKEKWTVPTTAVPGREGWWVIGYMDEPPNNATYPNRGKHVAVSPFTGEFDGNNDTDAADGGPYAISNLQIDTVGQTSDHTASDGNGGNYHIGLFGQLGSAGKIYRLTLKSVDIEHDSPYGATSTKLGAIVGEAAGDVEYVEVTGTVDGPADTGGITLNHSGSLAIGAAVGEVASSGAVLGSSSDASVITSGPWQSVNAGGLVGVVNGGDVTASYTTGTVNAAATTANLFNPNNPVVYAGGLVGEIQSSGSVEHTYATGAVSASGPSTPTAGGLVGRMGGNIKYSYSLGVPSAGTKGGLVGSRGSGATTDSYWDSQTSGITASGQGTSKTTSQLQTPTDYTGIYVNWEQDLDSVASGTQDPWDFGTSTEYPALDYGRPKPATPPTVTWSASPTTIWESNNADSTRATTSTLTVTFSKSWTEDITYNIPASASEYTLSSSTIAMRVGSTSGIVTLTAVNNRTKEASDNVVTITPTTDDARFTAGVTSPSITIRNDDELANAPTGLALAKVTTGSNAWTALTATWNEVADSTSYELEYKKDTVSTWTKFTGNTGHGGTTVTGLLSYETYDVRVKAKKTGSEDSPWSSTETETPGTDYDTDDDGMIEVSSLAQLNAIRYDLDASGAADNNSDVTSYTTAFTNGGDGMGCPSTGCIGYEIRASLDFDTGTKGTRNDDTYWNGGLGWNPIGGTAGTGKYTGSFDGNADTDSSGDGGPYTISNLFIDRTSGQYAGLFANLGGTGKKFEDVALVNVDVTFNTTTTTGATDVWTGGLAGLVGSGVTIEDSYTTGRVRAGESATDSVTFNGPGGNSHVGGLVGDLDGKVVSSYSLADVTAYTEGATYAGLGVAGGLTGYVSSTGSIDASYAAGSVVADTRTVNAGFAHAGGLAGYVGGAVRASYARGDATAYYDASVTTGIFGDVYAAGLVAVQEANITASFSTGASTATGDGTTGTGGLVASKKTAGSTTDSYWDTATSGTTSSATGTGKTTSELQTPTAYGTQNTDIYKDWNLNLDGVSGGDDPWDFGTAYQYPTLKYSELVAADQRAKVTLSVAPATIYERAVTTPSRTNQSTITATLDKAWNEDVVVTLPTNAAYTLSASTVTISAGSTSTTATLTADNNFVDAADNVVALTQANHPTDTTWVIKGTDVSITIADDDSLTKPANVKLSVDGTKIQVDWDAVTGATGYKVERSTASDFSANLTSATPSTNTHSITTGLTAGTRYYFRVTATSSDATIDDSPVSDVSDIQTHGTSPATVDYDSDNDGLIEIDSLAQLNAIRYDLDGDGAPSTGNETAYNNAFLNAEDNMGCHESAVTISAGTGNPVCDGYELSADLDFDENGNGNRDDTYNTGAGWTPIGTYANPYTGDFDGNNGTRTIKNLFINATSSADDTIPDIGGLFGRIGSGATIKNVALTGVSVTVSSTHEDEIHAGALAADNRGTITGSWSLGTVTGSTQNVSATSWVYAGGLVGRNDKGGSGNTAYEGIIRGSYSRAAATAKGNLNLSNGTEAAAGGLVARNKGTITASYAAGDATAANSVSNRRTHTARAGGLVGDNSGPITASYATGAVSAVGDYVDSGGLVGRNQSGGTVTASYSIGAVSGDAARVGPTAEQIGGLIGENAGTATNSYWDTDTSGQSTSAAGTAKTTSELQTPTGTTGIYANWSVDVDGDGTADSPWNFGTTSQYPVLSYGNHVLTKQRNAVTVGVNPTTIWERSSASPGPTRTNESTITATLTHAWEDDVTVTLPAHVVYTSNGTANLTVVINSATSATLTLSGHSTAWYLKLEPAGTCTSKGTDTTHALTGLTSGTDYTYTAYSDSGCTTALASATFDTTDDYSVAPIVIAAGSTSATGTLTAVDDTIDQTSPDSRSASISATTVDSNVIALTITSGDDTITVNDDDNVYKVTGVKLSVDGTKIQVNWTAAGSASAATGYRVEWSTSSAFTGTPGSHDVSGKSSSSYKIDPSTALTAGTEYFVRVIATASGEIDAPPSDVVSTTTHATTPATKDYDADNDGLIEITTLAQLNAVRYDLNGDGVPTGTSTEITAYNTAFANAEDNMGCNESVVTISSGTGNPVCTGYELSNNLDFDTNNDGVTNVIGDTYWNAGAGWQPIAHESTSNNSSSDPFDAIFEGNNYVISNLFINRRGTRTGISGSYKYELFAGLFGDVGSSAEIRNLGVEDVNVTFKNYLTSIPNAPEVYAGGLVGYSEGEIFKTYVTGTVTATAEASPNADKHPHAGGLIGRQVGGSITSSYARVTTTASFEGGESGGVAYAGGLVAYQSGGDIVATYARGSATAIVRSINNGKSHAGGLIGYHKDGEIKSSYSEADATATGNAVSPNFTISPELNAGGLVGTQDGGTITASYSTGAPTANTSGTGTVTSPTNNTGGLTGNHSSGTTTNSYWDTTTSGITATGQGTGKTTTELKTPTSFAGIYANWEFDLDNADNDNDVTTGKDNQWNFGTASDYPVLQYHLTIPPQRATVTLTLSAATIWESNVGNSSRVTSSTVTATLNNASWHTDVVVTPLADTAYSLANITVTAGNKTATGTLNAVNNYLCGTSTCPSAKVNETITITATTNDPWVSVGTAPSITINDDDELAQAIGVKLSVHGTKIKVDWDAVTGATGYKVQYHTANNDWANATEATISSGSTVTYTTPALTAATTYYFRVLPTKSGADEPPSGIVSTKTHGTSPATVDYDHDNDGLIEITTLAQLDAIRYDLDGNGQVASGDQTAYNTAFPNAEDNMGCNESIVTITSNNTGNPDCDGYELSANLNFDTGTANDRTDDTYYNSGQGWLPIGATAGSATASAFTAEFQGNTYKISNLHINRSGSTTVAHGGLFAELGSAARVKNLRLEGVDIVVTTHVTASTPADVYAGGIAGKSAGAITGSYVLGEVKAVQSENTANDNEKHAYAGGIVGWNTGGVTSSYSRADVTAEQLSTTAQLTADAGGIAGHQETGGAVTASFTTGVIVAETRSTSGGDVNVGGLLGRQEAGSVKASYSHAHPEAKAPTTAAGVTLDTGGLVGHIESAGSITASYSTGAPTHSGGSSPAVRNAGFVGNYVAGTITHSYWDTETSGKTTGTAGAGTTTGVTGKTSSELKTPTAYGTGSAIYANWNLNLDGVSGNDDPWDFGTNAQYPVLDYGLTAADQRAAVTISVSPTTICESTKGTTPCSSTSPPTSTTVTAAISPAQQVDVVVAITPSTSEFTLGATKSITIAAGNTSGTGSVTLTAVNNKKCGTADCTGTNGPNNSLTVAGTTAQTWANITGASLTITDDDILPAPDMTLTAGANYISMTVTWPAVTGATGYILEYKASQDANWTSVSSPTSPETISPLESTNVYTFRLAATKTGYDDSEWDTADPISPGKDYDSDDDGLIEITTHAQLNAVRYDLNGDGAVLSGDQTNYDAAFPTPATGMGCNEDETLPANQVCIGYELSNNIDLNTNNSAKSDANPTGADINDAYWNSGLGWDPIGGVTGSTYGADFNGNSFTISNLFINVTAGTGNYAGLFAYLNDAQVTNVGVENVDITFTTTNADHVYAGGLAGRIREGGTLTGAGYSVSGAYTTGEITVTGTMGSTGAHVFAGGLAGSLEGGVVVSSYSWADVTAVATGSGNTYTFAGRAAGHNRRAHDPARLQPAWTPASPRATCRRRPPAAAANSPRRADWPAR